MWLLLSIGCMALAVKAFSVSFTLALIPFAAGCLCFSKSNRSDLDDFMAFSFFIALVGFALNVLISVW
ncbi:hypothetical protein [Aeromonas sp. MR16]|uniref:hypothetical protein n=1 Tax=Aeromonas sp. MR16 TaxID=2923420 RepID=UPI001F4A13C7|nr:hypothetical protein [Aeromonas sp. MR16]MCH7369919.1 hypothetical protein [Aeromonas sp. MR16]